MNKSLSCLENMAEENERLNQEEYDKRQIILDSYPPAIFIQIDAPCNQDCLFCSRPGVYRHFDLEEYKKGFEKILDPAIHRAQRLNLTGNGELLLLPEAKRVLDYFNQFSHTEKMFATNGSTLTPKMIDFIAESENRYLIHISLHASQDDFHKIMTRTADFPLVLSNLDYLRRVREEVDNVKVNFIFLATSKNIENLPHFVRFASYYNVQRIIVYYNYIYRLDQRGLSCYFIPEKTNRIFDVAQEVVERLKVPLDLPPRFNQTHYPDRPLCREPWSQIMLNTEGDIIPCDVSGDTQENILEKEFKEVWNGEYYTNLRKSLVWGQNNCSRYCFRAAPSGVNEFRAHIISRGKSKGELARFLEGI